MARVSDACAHFCPFTDCVEVRVKRGLSYASVVVLYASKHGQSDESTGRRWRLLQFGIRVRDAVDRRRWAGAIVIANEFEDNTAGVIYAEEQEVVQCLLTKRSYQAFNV